VILIGLVDKAQWQNTRFDELMKKLPRGRADLFNLALGHISRSFLLWAYMGMTVKAAPTTPTTTASTATPATIKLNLSNRDSPSDLITSTVYSTTPSSTTSSSPWVTPKQLTFSPMPDYLSLSNSPIEEPTRVANEDDDDDNVDEEYAKADKLFIDKLFNTIYSQENNSENE